MVNHESGVIRVYVISGVKLVNAPICQIRGLLKRLSFSHLSMADMKRKKLIIHRMLELSQSSLKLYSERF